MAKKKTDTTDPVVKLHALNESVVKVFEQRYRKEQLKDKAYDEHCAPYDEDIKKLMDGLKSDTKGQKRDLNMWYKLWARQQDAKGFEEEDRDNILDTNRMMFNALSKGEMLDFMDVLSAADEYIPPALQQQADDSQANADEEAAESEAQL